MDKSLFQLAEFSRSSNVLVSEWEAKVKIYSVALKYCLVRFSGEDISTIELFTSISDHVLFSLLPWHQQM